MEDIPLQLILSSVGSSIVSAVITYFIVLKFIGRDIKSISQDVKGISEDIKHLQRGLNDVKVKISEPKEEIKSLEILDKLVDRLPGS